MFISGQPHDTISFFFTRDVSVRVDAKSRKEEPCKQPLQSYRQGKRIAKSSKLLSFLFTLILKNCIAVKVEPKKLRFLELQGPMSNIFAGSPFPRGSPTN